MINSASDHLYFESSLDQTFKPSWWQSQSIRFKTTVVAIAIGTIPTIAIGLVAYHFAARSVNQETTSLRKTLVGDLQNQVNIFIRDRFQDTEVMAALDVFTNPKLRNVVSAADQKAALEKIQAAYGIYNSIGVFDLKGEVIAQTGAQPLGNHLNRGYIQAALKADQAVISQPRISTSSGIYSVYTASPIKDKYTGKTIGFVRTRIPVAVLKELLQDFTTGGSEYYLLNDQGEIFLGSQGEYVIKTRSDTSRVDNKNFDYEAVSAQKVFQDAAELLSSRKIDAGISINANNQAEQFLTFAPPRAYKGLPPLNWQAIIATDSSIVFAPQRNLRRVFFLGTGLVALGVGAIAYSLANRMLNPILQAADAVKEIGQGNFDVNLQITGADQIAQLGANINQMSQQLLDFVQVQTLLTQSSEAIKNTTLQFANADSNADILKIAVAESYQLLLANRVVYYQFESDVSGLVISEEVADGFAATLNTEILNPDLIAAYFNQHQNGKAQVEVINNVTQAGANQQKLAALGVKTSLAAPVVIENQLDGLLIVHQCSDYRPWLDVEVEFVTQIANQIGFAIARLEFLEQQKLAENREKEAKEAIQTRALSLLQEVSDVSEGDLTIRAKVTADEIGTIADSYNSTIESLQMLVNQTKAAAIEVQSNTFSNDVAIQELAKEAVDQVSEINQMLELVKAMEQLSQKVALNAAQAENFVKQANLTIDSSDKAINQTVAEISAVQNTVTETAAKAQKLGESSLEISQAVNLIGRFAAQTHLLALKASIEAARAGEQGKGFAVIAEEVRSLATQSAEATSEVETLVNKIQLETNVLVESMNQGAEQIVSGNELVQQTRNSLTEVSEAGSEISKLVSSITQAVNLQSATSAQVSQTMVNVATSAENNSRSATKVSTSIKQLSSVAEKLQSGIGRFKT